MVEILKKFIELNGGFVKESLQMFLDKPEILNDYFHVADKNLYLNDNVIFIKKNTLDVQATGIVINISKDKICVSKRSNKSCIFLNYDDYYIFTKKVKNKNNDRIFYENLLKIL
tara:strand:- start:136 stop:477 length:342 start_codon:yes stop_codon:yes gene_type:complete